MELTNGHHYAIEQSLLGSTPIFKHKRRGGISSESPGDHSPVITVAKKQEQTHNKLQRALERNILFKHLDNDERSLVIDVMYEQSYVANDIIIHQGDKGDHFYIVDHGHCDIYIKKDNNQPPAHVMEVTAGGSFGELALIYGSPRAATVVARTDVKLWAIDRIAYRTILKVTTTYKRELYERFLENVSILSPLERHERVCLADALEPCSFKHDETIVRQGDPGEIFYIIVEGEVRVTQNDEQGAEIEVSRLRAGQYFGEIALLTKDSSRAATVTSVGVTKCVGIDRQRFNRLLGPCMHILQRNMDMYNQLMHLN
ncbi:hypothetical protein SAMD00019534_107190 [Acytostelium subglobosum LB1]|uniref:hypothetical protein n=1 Tax=Acytostelium subglobosum LB1 TaxID=1410327 RepID=UPI000644F8E4|nr:hypothetical protein SAMD00019534_107190 [Acytostelium subglobosum LB1]GAM27543.1 hypothetical protein SAMD00019534_107190 [Acytostelium subglobosum LB1]|eukprot:XP_012749608.1 hypothetical protein SAMD00019534_107190 [Acytostelium subglobosum LB1]